MRRFTSVWLTLALLALALTGCSGLGGEPLIVSQMPTIAPPVPVELPSTVPSLAMGAAVFAQNCTDCHGAIGAGDGVLVQNGQITQIINFLDPTSRTPGTVADYFTTITNGRIEALMPPWAESLSEPERWSAALYVYALPIIMDAADEPALDAAGIMARAALFSPSLTVEQQAEIAEYAVRLRDGAAPAQQAAADPAVNPADPAVIGPAEAPVEVVMTVRGTLSNGTAGAIVPAGVPLTLYLLDQFHRETLTGVTLDGGAYVFDDVPFDPNRQYAVAADYNGVTFASAITPPPTAPEAGLDLPVTIYEAGADASTITIERVLSQIDVLNGEMHIIQLVRFLNTSDRVFATADAAGELASVSVPVPPGAIYRDFMGTGYHISADGLTITDTRAVVPGQTHTMHVTFTLPYDAAMTNGVVQSFLYPFSGDYEVALGTPGITLLGDALTAGTPSMPDMQAAAFYSGTLTLPPNAEIRYALSGTPIAPAPADNPIVAPTINPLALILLGVGAAALVTAAVLYALERRSAARTSADPAEPAAQSLMRRIAELDVQRQQGKITTAAYDRERAALKAQLKSVLHTQTQGGD